MARSLSPIETERSPSPSSPSAATNTLAVTCIPKSFFDPTILSMLREHFTTFGEINQWVPLQGFGRILIVYESELHAESAKETCDPIVIDHHDGTQVVLRVYRADPNPLIVRGDDSWLPQTYYLQPPPIEKNFLISPPGSPPVGWEQVKEDPPNMTPLADDLIQALRKLQVLDERPAKEQLLDTHEFGGVCISVEDYDADQRGLEIADEDWVHGETAPARDKWKTFATAMPPIPT